MEILLLLFALGYSGLLLFLLAGALRRSMAPRRAALFAFGISAVVHGATTLLMDAEARLSVLLFWGIPHLLLLPLLLVAAARQTPR
jgi:predicted MFS family arabinose efflux permease